MIRRIQFYLLAAILAIIASCNQPSHKVIIPDPNETAGIKVIGDSMAQILAKTLKKELKAAIEAGGFMQGINVCSQSAQRITDSIALATNYRIKRTTNKFRNPVNAPDSIEQLALAHFEKLIAESGEFPEFYIQKIEGESQDHYRYYKPMRMETLCLGCHGIPENIDTATLTRIKAYYPNDLATGYSAGDFRGLISVTIPQ